MRGRARDARTGSRARPRTMWVRTLCTRDRTHNVKREQMRIWSQFYGKLFGFEEQKHFDIMSKATGCSARR